MKKSILISVPVFLFVFTLFFSLPLFSGIVNVPGDYPTIQAGIGAATTGDTVLVQPDTYVENINFNGNNIVVGSLFLTTGNTSYISQTIIESNVGTVVRFENGENSTAILCGFTITTSEPPGCGIRCSGSGPILTDLIIRDFFGNWMGGGIYCGNNAIPQIINVTITDNLSELGGGIYCSDSSPTLFNVTITDNQAFEGGGIFCVNSDLTLEIVMIANNRANYHKDVGIGCGGGIACFASDVTMKHVVITENLAIDSLGGGLFYNGDNLTMKNVTISRNQAFQGDGICQSGGYLLLANAIVWDNEDEEIRLRGGGNTIEIAYSDIEGGITSVIAGVGNTLNWLEGNIDSDPLFINPYIGDFRIQAGSPCIDTGDPDLDDDGIPWQSDPDDQDPDGTRLDMGAFYYQTAVTSLEITYPAISGIAWERLTREEIQWNSYGSVGSHIKMYLYKEGIHYYTIDESVPNTGSYSWFVSRRVETGDDYQILIMSTTNAGIYYYSSVFSIVPSSTVPPQQQYTALQIESANIPVMDGNLNDAAWSGIDVDSLVYGGALEDYMADWTQFADNLVTWKAVWCDATNKLYVGIEVQDDIRGTFDNEPSSSDYDPAHDESLGFVVDGDYSGGDYYEMFNWAQYWRVTGENHRDLLYYPNHQSTAQEYTGNAFVTAVQQGTNGNWTCEAVFEIYDDFPGSLRDLEEGDFIGWDIWYNDSDDETYNGSYYETDHQTGWNYQGAVWRRTDYSGDLILGGTGTDVKGEPLIPLTTTLHPNYPNPFNPETTIKYQLSQSGKVRLVVYDIMGRVVKALVDDQKSIGFYEVSWDGRNEFDQKVASGIYVCRISVTGKATRFTKTMKMVLLK